MEINWAAPEVQAAAIQAMGTAFAAFVAGLWATIVGRMMFKRQKLQAELERAHSDIEFMLAVEEAHGLLHHEQSGTSRKLIARRMATESGHSWSGRLTRSRLAARRRRHHEEDGALSLFKKLLDRVKPKTGSGE